MVDISQLMPSWIPAGLAKAWEREFYALGGSSVPGAAANATEIMRTDPKYQDRYDRNFPGNRREDGTLRLTEQEYSRRVDAYANALEGVNVNPDVFRRKFGGLIEGDVGEAEFTQRVESMYERVIDSAPAIKSFYAENWGRDMSDSAIVASFLDPDVGNAILDRRIAISEIGGEASQKGFDLGLDWSKKLYRAGVSKEQAQGLFGAGATEVPLLNVLAQRHEDPDDEFDIKEFTQAAIFDDPVQRRRMRRLMAQEESTWSGDAVFKEDRESGGMTGLAAR